MASAELRREIYCHQKVSIYRPFSNPPLLNRVETNLMKIESLLSQAAVFIASETKKSGEAEDVTRPLSIVFEKMIGTVEGIKNMGPLEKSLLSLSFFLEFLTENSNQGPHERLGFFIKAVC